LPPGSTPENRFPPFRQRLSVNYTLIVSRCCCHERVVWQTWFLRSSEQEKAPMLITNRFLPKSIRLPSLAVLILFALMQNSPSGLAQQPGGNKLAKVEFEGTKRLTHDQLLSTSGLEIGQPINVAALDAAGQRLMDSGLLKKLSYRLHTVNNEATVIFKIEEAAGLRHPAIFDNFIWFTDDELANAVRHDVPSFDGTALDEGNMTDEIAHALQLLLNERKLAGKVEYMPLAYEGTTKWDHLFSVSGVHMPVCELHFSGTTNVPEDRLIKSSKDLMGKDYSRSSTSAFASKTLFPIYRELGQLRASFGQPTAKPQTSEGCKDGAEVTIPVEEGPIYSWENAEWSGNQIIAAADLDKALQMKPGEVANGLKIDKGIEAVRKLYRRKGYLQLSVKPTAVFDDQTNKVAFRLEVKEGPQYRMGNLIVKGLPDNQTNYLRGKWEMLKGDVYDAGYAEDFFKSAFREVFRKIVEERQTQGKPKPEVTTSERPNRADLTVDVIFEFTEKKEQ